MPSIPGSVPAERPGTDRLGEFIPWPRPRRPADMQLGFDVEVRTEGCGMDRDTLQDDLDLVLGPPANAEPIGEWDWEPPLGTAPPRAGSADEPQETDEPGDRPSDGPGAEDDEDEG